jgi:hypothetical protein
MHLSRTKFHFSFIEMEFTILFNQKIIFKKKDRQNLIYDVYSNKFSIRRHKIYLNKTYISFI